jgi:gliding motility-associated-like protein
MKRILIFVFLVYNFILFSQVSNLTINVVTTPYKCIKGTADVHVSGGVSPYYFNWSNGFHGDFQEQMDPGNYNLTIVQGNGRDTTITVTIKEEKCQISYSNSFSPNGDGINDAWSISNWTYFPDFRLYIYNRWGQLVHKQSKEFFPWDGKHLGLDLPVGAYYFVFYYSADDNDVEKGSIVIMR